jgi:hypothetical protein
MLRCRRHLEGEEEDMRKIRWLVMGVAAALLVHAETAAAAPPDFTAAAKLCAAQGGQFASRLDGSAYRCSFSEAMSPRELSTARALCTAYNGLLSATLSSPAHYECIIQP